LVFMMFIGNKHLNLIEQPITGNTEIV